jgi:hypothetical protein
MRNRLWRTGAYGAVTLCQGRDRPGLGVGGTAGGHSPFARGPSAMSYESSRGDRSAS